MNAVVYCRTVSKPQSGFGNVLRIQESICRRFAKKNGYRIDRVFAEQASGTSNDREELKKLMEYARRNKVKLRAIIVHSFNRLARNCSRLCSLTGAIKQMGLELLSVTDKNETKS